MTNTSIESNSHSNRKIVLFDLSIRGHHPNYIKYLIQYWYEHQLPGYLDIVVSPRFLKEHSEVIDLATRYTQVNINFVAIALEDEAVLKSRKSLFQRTFRNFQEWKIFCKYTDSLGANHALIMYFDTCMLPLTLGVKAPCSFSGIYFRPTFHYNEFKNYHLQWQDRLQQLKEKIFLSRILRNYNLKKIFCLDMFAVKHLKKINTHVEFIALPDPVQTLHSSDDRTKHLKTELGIEETRRVFLLFGALTSRKGIYQLLAAISALSIDLCQKICLLLIGESSIQPQIKKQIDAICQSKPIQIIEKYEFVAEQDVQNYFQLTHVVLAPYQRHVGMSGILLLAAAAQKPVLSSDYGLMGEIVRRYELGLTVDSTRPAAITKGLTRLLMEDLDKFCDRQKMQQFAHQNSAEYFAQVIFQSI